MIVRTKSGDFKADNFEVLLDFLGVKKEAGAAKVKADVELIAAVTINSEQLAVNTLKSAGAPDMGGVAWTLSTFDLDRYGERIDPMGWDFSRYAQNPVVQWAHRYDIPAIGKIEGLAVDDNGLHGVVIFNDKSFDAFGWSIGERVKAGVIRAGSVGFRVIEIEIPDKETAKDGTSLIFRKQELLEFSICNVPANPFALAVNSEQLAVNTLKSADAPDMGGVAWTLSTFDLDRYGERIDPLGWDFSRYAQNPVVQWAHRYDIPAIGKIEGLAVDDNGLHGVVVFNDKAFDAFGWSIGERVKAGVIRAGSVGFRVIEIEIPDKETAKDGTSLIFRKQELLEFSICNVPANPFALAVNSEQLAVSTMTGASAQESRDLGFSSFWGNIINSL